MFCPQHTTAVPTLTSQPIPVPGPGLMIATSNGHGGSKTHDSGGRMTLNVRRSVLHPNGLPCACVERTRIAQISRATASRHPITRLSIPLLDIRGAQAYDTAGSGGKGETVSPSVR